MTTCYECGWSDEEAGYFTQEGDKMYCSLHRSLSYQELSELTHETQVERFNWCECEEQENFPYKDCPRVFTVFDMVCPDCDCFITQITSREPFANCSCGGIFTLISEKKALPKEEN